MIHRRAAASLLIAGILLLFISSQAYVTAIDADDNYMTEKEKRIEKMLTLWGNETETAGVDMDDIRRQLHEAAQGIGMEEFLEEIDNIDDDIENNPASKLSYQEKQVKIFKFQDDPFDVYQRWKWDAQFCSPEIFGVGLFNKIYFNPKMVEIMSSVCKKAVQIGTRIISILIKKHSMTFPWSPELNAALNLDSMSIMAIEYHKDLMGDDHKMSAVIARLHPETYKVTSIGYTKDYERLWNKRKEDKSIPLIMIAKSYLMNALDPTSPNEYQPYLPELKLLTDYLLLLFGHPAEVAKDWVMEDEVQGTAINTIGTKMILTTIYSTFVALGEYNHPAIPEYDEEPPFKEFLARIDIKKFIADMEYNYDTDVSIDDVIAERKQDRGEL